MIPPLAWSAPWFAPLREHGAALGVALADGRSAADALNAQPGAAARFVTAAALPAGEAYESFIARTGQVPTRDNLHDLFNGLIWLTQPVLKRRLNTLHAAAIARRGLGPTRGPLRDALTLFDENGATLVAPPALAEALRARDWHALFVSHRMLWRQATFLIVGHALLEKLCVAPRKSLTAHVVLGDAMRLTETEWAAKPFCPLPVLGLPGWWPDNEHPGFYEDDTVFRPRRDRRSILGRHGDGRKPSTDR